MLVAVMWEKQPTNFVGRPHTVFHRLRRRRSAMGLATSEKEIVLGSPPSAPPICAATASRREVPGPRAAF